MNTVIFDLDGTITDPSEGITKSINYSLIELGFPSRQRKELLIYIGKHLIPTFSELTGTEDKEVLTEAVKLFRARYIPVGYRECKLYDGIVDILSFLADGGSKLCIATLKRQDVALNVIRYLEIDKYFTQICGCDLYRSKADLLRDILDEKVLGKRPIIMIGDRDTDFLAASEVNMSSLAVRWGFGEEEEYILATDVVSNPEDLPEAIISNVRFVD